MKGYRTIAASIAIGVIGVFQTIYDPSDWRSWLPLVTGVVFGALRLDTTGPVGFKK